MKYLSYLRIALLLIAVILFVLSLSGLMEIDTILYLAYFLLGATILLAIGLPLINIVQNPKGAVKSLIGLVLVAVVILIAWGMSNADPIILASGTVIDDSTILKISDTALYLTYFAFAGVLASIVGTEIYKLFK